jgi:hypothetical protein
MRSAAGLAVVTPHSALSATTPVAMLRRMLSL